VLCHREVVGCAAAKDIVKSRWHPSSRSRPSNRGYCLSLQFSLSAIPSYHNSCPTRRSLGSSLWMPTRFDCFLTPQKPAHHPLDPQGAASYRRRLVGYAQLRRAALYRSSRTSDASQGLDQRETCVGTGPQIAHTAPHFEHTSPSPRPGRGVRTRAADFPARTHPRSCSPRSMVTSKAFVRCSAPQQQLCVL